MLTMLLLLMNASCIKKTNHADMAGPDEYYTCSMDPQVIENKAGNCPICHMKLIKVKRNNLKPGQIQLSEQQIKLANITFDTLRIHELSKEITLTGKVTFDQNLSEAISSRVQGRIEKLLVKNVGDYISEGQLLYEIYSEDLNAAQSEYLYVIQKSNASESFATAAKKKLLLYGMSEEQINRIKTSKHIIEYISVYSSAEGFVTETSVVEGNYVSSGMTLFRLASMSSLWVEAQVYLPYLPYLKVGTEAKFHVASASDEAYTGKVIFIDPQVQSPERFVLGRFQIINPSQQIKPGMLANIVLQTEKHKSFTLPDDAVIIDSKGANVWVRNKDVVFENKMVTIGMQNSTSIEILDGLSDGYVVVVSGAYLLNSEYVFKRGASPMEGHQDIYHDMPGMKIKSLIINK